MCRGTRRSTSRSAAFGHCSTARGTRSTGRRHRAVGDLPRRHRHPIRRCQRASFARETVAHTKSGRMLSRAADVLSCALGRVPITSLVERQANFPRSARTARAKYLPIVLSPSGRRRGRSSHAALAGERGERRRGTIKPGAGARVVQRLEELPIRAVAGSRFTGTGDRRARKGFQRRPGSSTADDRGCPANQSHADRGGSISSAQLSPACDGLDMPSSTRRVGPSPRPARAPTAGSPARRRRSIAGTAPQR